MNLKALLQVTLVIIALIISAFFYLSYFNTKKINKNIDQKLNLNEDKLTRSDGNTIKKISYESDDNNGNKYTIKSELGKFDNEDKEEILMTTVSAQISLKNGTIIFLNSKNALYNTLNSDTNFFNDVELKYLNHIINSDNIDISFKNNKLEAYNNLVYKNFDISLLADKAEINLITQDSKIYMFDNSQVKIMRD